MADETNPETQAGESTTDPTVDQQTHNESDSVEETRNALRKANREAADRRRELAKTQERLRELEDAQKTETEREREARTTAERERDDLRLELRRLKIASEFNLSPTIAERLRGDDDEAMRADAKALVAELDPEGDLGARRGGQRPPNNDPNASLRALFGR